MLYQNDYIILTAILLLTLTASGCVHSNDDETTRIGVLTPLTGSGAVYGKAVRRGIELYKEEHMNNTVKLYFENSKCQTKPALTGYRTLKQVHDIDILIGAVCSPGTIATASLTRQANILHVSPTASSPTVSDTHVLRLYPSDTLQAKKAVELMRKSGYHDVAVLHINNDYGRALQKAFATRWKGNITTIQPIEKGGADFRTKLLRIKATRPDALYVIGLVEETARIAKQMAKLDIQLPIVGTESLNNPKLFRIGGESVEGIRFPTAKNYNGSTHQEFVSKFRSEYGSKPGIYADYGWDSLKVIHKALTNTNGTYSTMRNYLISTNFTGATGPINFDRNGDVQRSYTYLEVRNGTFRKLNLH